MFVISMNSKRQRRPNVRLGEIGDFSAALLCGLYAKDNESLVRKRYKNDLLKVSSARGNLIYGVGNETADQFLGLDPAVSSMIFDDSQQNTENKNPNSSKSALELVNGDEVDVSRSELNFCNVKRKCRVTKRRARSAEGNNNVFGGVWSYKLGWKVSDEDGENCNPKEFVDACIDGCANDFKDLSDDEMIGTSKDVYDYDEHPYDARQGEDHNMFEQEDALFQGNNVSLTCGPTCNEMRFGDKCINNVTRWLDDQGFGKYAGLFEMHEVDNEALPLLTIEDLKEMGLFAVGSRRKLYIAIQQLRKGDVYDEVS